MKITTYSVAPAGIGKRDFSVAIQRSTAMVIAPRTNRIAWNVTYPGLATFPWPNCWGTGPWLFFDEDNNIVDVAPRTPYHIFEGEASSPMNALTLWAFLRFPSMADYFAWNWDRWYGDYYGYGKARMKLTSGIKTEFGCVYTAVFSVYSEFPTFDVTLDVHGVEEDPDEYRVR